MREEIKTPPRTIMEVFKMLPEGTLAELIEDTLYMSPAPTTNHQSIVLEISSQLLGRQKLKGGKVLTAACDVFLDETSNAVRPDIIFVLSENLQIVKADAIHGVPDFLIEVLSPGNAKHDLVRKKELYEKFGVKEYWVIDPETKESIGYSLKDRIYIECGRFTGQINSVLLQQIFEF
jgi:Uma2 family endonuclease